MDAWRRRLVGELSLARSHTHTKMGKVMGKLEKNTNPLSSTDSNDSKWHNNRAIESETRTVNAWMNLGDVWHTCMHFPRKIPWSITKKNTETEKLQTVGCPLLPLIVRFIRNEEYILWIIDFYYFFADTKFIFAAIWFGPRTQNVKFILYSCALECSCSIWMHCEMISTPVRRTQ